MQDNYFMIHICKKINSTFVENGLCRGKSYLGFGNKNAHSMHVSTSFSRGGFD